MGEESKTGIQGKKISEEESPKASQSNKQTTGSIVKNNSSTDSSITKKNKKSTKRFRDFLMGSEILDSETDSNNEIFNNKSSDKSQEKKVNNQQEDNITSESHEFHLSQEFMKFKTYRYLHSNKEQIIRIIGGLIGVLFIIAGVLYLFGGSIRVADNVIYGERAVLSAFSILIGILIIAGFFGSRLLAGTFLKKIHSELEEVEEAPSDTKSPKEKEKSFHEKEKQKDNIEEKDKK